MQNTNEKTPSSDNHNSQLRDDNKSTSCFNDAVDAWVFENHGGMDTGRYWLNGGEHHKQWLL